MSRASKIGTLFFFGLSAAASLAPLPLVAQAPAATVTGKLTSIKFKGSLRYAQAGLLAAGGLASGQQIGIQDLQAAADRLSGLGLFRHVRFTFTSLGEDVSVVYELEDGPTVPVYFDNFPWFTDEELSAALKSQFPLFDGTAPEDGAMLEQMAAALQSLLASRNVSATVQRQLIGRPGADGMMQQFHIIGPALKVGAVRFEHPLAAGDKRINALLSELIGKPYSRFTTELFAFEHLRPVYLERGHLRAEFGPPQVRFTGDPRKPLPDNVLVVVPIAPGPAYTWGGAAWTGISVHSSDALNTWLGLAPGDIVDGMKLTAAWERIRAEYGRLGHLDASLDISPAFDPAAARVSYRIAVTEGVQYRMGELVLTGLSMNAERTLRSAWQVLPGQVFDRVWFDDFVATGIRRLFSDTPVHFTKIGPLLQPNAETGIVSVFLDFQ